MIIIPPESIKEVRFDGFKITIIFSDDEKVYMTKMKAPEFVKMIKNSDTDIEVIHDLSNAEDM